MAKRLQLCFLTPSAFRRELDRNIVCGGAFVETDERYAIGEKVELGIDLPFCGQSVMLEATVVNRVRPAMSRTVGRAGIAVQFAEPAHVIYQRLSDIAAVDTSAELAKRRKQPGGPARVHPRTPVRVPAIVETNNGRRTGHTMEMSRSGVRVEFDGPPMPIGQQVMLSLAHPDSSEALHLPGRVVRHGKSENQRNQIGVEFDFDPSNETPETCALDRFFRAVHARLLGEISGDLSAIGITNLLQMASSSSERGTLVLKQGVREARVLFKGGALLYVSVGAATGKKALARLLAWTEGKFEYTPSVDADEPEELSIPLDALLLEATHRADELRRLDLSHFQPAATIVPVRKPEASDDLDNVASAVLEAISAGIVTGDLLDMLTEFDDDVYRALTVLRRLGIICITDVPER